MKMLFSSDREVEHRQVLGISKLVGNVRNVGKWIGVSYHFFIKSSEVDYNPPLSFAGCVDLFRDDKKWWVIGRLGASCDATFILFFYLGIYLFSSLVRWPVLFLNDDFVVDGRDSILDQMGGGDLLTI